MSKLKRCSHNHKDCFMNKDGKCVALVEMIGKSECPFYKTTAQADEDKWKSYQRLLSIGRTDLIEKYENNRNFI